MGPGGGGVRGRVGRVRARAVGQAVGWVRGRRSRRAGGLAGAATRPGARVGMMPK